MCWWGNEIPMSDLGTMLVRVRQVVEAANSNRGQIKPIGWVMLIFFIAATFIFYFAMISQI